MRHLNGGAARCKLCGQLYLGESLGSLMINLLVRARQPPSWGDWCLLYFQRLEHILLTKGEVMVKCATEEIPRPSMGQNPGGKWKHWGLPLHLISDSD